jgi:hypothetical protein
MAKVLRIPVSIAALILFMAIVSSYVATAGGPDLDEGLIKDNLIVDTEGLKVKIDSDLKSQNTSDEIKFLQENGIIKGDPNGDLRPDDELSRAEFAAILCRAIGIEELAQSAAMAEKNYFSDVPASHWAAGYINAAVEYKAINGFADGTFRPGLSVTNEQVVKMLVAAWGYGEEAEELGGYPNGYMEIAQRFGVTEAVLFNYGVASKRWVACSFTYGALAMPAAENCTVETTVKIEQAEERVLRPENTGYIADPASILKKVTPQSAKYERKLFEQKVPEGMMPVKLQDNTLLYDIKAVSGVVQYYFWKPDSKQSAMSGNLPGADTIDLSPLPPGQFQFQLVITDGTVQDTYFAKAEKKDGGTVEFVGDIFRYTVLNAQPKITEIRHDITLNNNQKNEHNPYVIEALYNEAAKPILRVSYPFVVSEDQFFSISINTIWDPSIFGELYHPPVYIEGEPNQNLNSAPQPLTGQNMVIKPMIIDGLSINEPYLLQLCVSYNTGDDVALRGEIKLVENDGKLDFLLEGIVRYVEFEGYEILDYEIIKVQ